jgi:hypothetical protein
MKKYHLPIFLFILATLLGTNCKERTSQRSLHLGQDQICLAATPDAPRTCLPIDAGHLVALSTLGGQPHLQTLSLDRMPGTAPGTLSQLAQELKRLGLAQSFDPLDTDIQVVDGDWIFASKHLDAPPRLTLDEQRMRHSSSFLINNGDEWLLTTLAPQPQQAAASHEAEGSRNGGGGLATGRERDLTDSIKVATLRSCPLTLTVEGNKVTAHFGIGLAEVLDDVGEDENRRRNYPDSLDDSHGQVHPALQEWQDWFDSFQASDAGSLAFASPAGPHLAAVERQSAGPAPIYLASDETLFGEESSEVPVEPYCQCVPNGRRVVYQDYGLWLVNSDNTRVLWVDLHDMNCEFCIDRYLGNFRIRALKVSCIQAFNCVADIGCFR